MNTEAAYRLLARNEEEVLFRKAVNIEANVFMERKREEALAHAIKVTQKSEEPIIE
jgi:hypothetical protein